MGLADRFKDKLETKNIFEKKGIEQSLAVNNIQFISKPITDNTLSQQKTARQGQIDYIENIIEINESQSKHLTTKFEELETEIIKKIRNTPYWEEYTPKRQEQMISKYFDNRIQNSKYSTIKYSTNERQDFIQNILALSNNR